MGDRGKCEVVETTTVKAGYTIKHENWVKIVKCKVVVMEQMVPFRGEILAA